MLKQEHLILFIYILFTYLVMVITLVEILFVALMVTIKKANNQKKNTPLSGS